MIVPFAYQGKHVGVFGLARTGLAAVESLKAAGAVVHAWDDQDTRRMAAADVLDDLYSADFSRLDALLLAPGVPLTFPEPHPLVVKSRAHGLPLIADFDLFDSARRDLPEHRLVAVTGTNGKSTTVALIAHILKEAGRPVALGGNIGTGILALDALDEGGVYVIEASSFQLELAERFGADVAVQLNMAADHLDRHGDMEGYRAAKARLFSLQGEGAVRIISQDDDYSRKTASEFTGVSPLSVEAAQTSGVSAVDGILIDHDAGAAITSLLEYPVLAGAHNHQNAAAAYAVCRAVGLEIAEIKSGLASFPGLVHRQERVAEISGVTYINDSKATNVDAASRALGTFRNIHWIAGGRAKGESLAPLLPLMPRVKDAYLIGESASVFERALDLRVETKQAGTLEKAVEMAAQAAVPGDVVLLSPACTAFDAYRDFEARGDAFKAAVQALTETTASSGDSA